MAITKITMSIREVSEYTGIGQTTLYQLAREGKIPHKRVKSKVIFLREVIDKWLRDE
ncbi:hypothetical protein COJ46_02550 [Bacillus sp. AFS077874]|uniref:helix-turn-helix domain-containing protein n=1 Tax=Bacillus sp. AFS077874 TaxID=2033513 RepID=UPI000BF91CE8|nr:helix-turn-helix domain-containing protein [Bacillus sp. AFS077874]PFM82707.1 hypothetical protein COJ46_02550 [Bacillus sp. AFS077874]